MADKDELNLKRHLLNNQVSIHRRRREGGFNWTREEKDSVLVVRKTDLLKAKPLLAGCGSRGPKARAGGFRPCSNYLFSTDHRGGTMA